MPRYFFDVHNDTPTIDIEGEDLSDNEAAWREAIAVASELIRNSAGKFKPGQDWRLEVTDERRNPIYNVRVYGEEI